LTLSLQVLHQAELGQEWDRDIAHDVTLLSAQQWIIDKLNRIR
jgi:hypothetical protein